MNNLDKKVIKVYIAGPYRSDDGFWKIQENIHRAWKTAIEVGQLGQKYENIFVVPVCPHTIFGHMDGALPGQWFVDATMVLCKDCHITFIVDCTANELHASSGTLGEITATRDDNKPVIYDMIALEMYLNQLDAAAGK